MSGTMGSVNMERFVNGLHEWAAKKIYGPLQKRIEALEGKVDALQERGLEYRGIFKSAEVYRKGDVCTHSGSLWIAHRQTNEAPPGNGWTLAVKQGRDAR